MADWNPPPPERDEGSASNVVPDKDRIGDTVFSKAWVLSLLVKAVKAVDSSTSEPEREVSAMLALCMCVCVHVCACVCMCVLKIFHHNKHTE